MENSVLNNISYGMYIVSSVYRDKNNGQVANCIIQITNQPVTIAASINKNNLTHKYISESGLFSVSILEKNTPLSLIGKFGFRSGRDSDKFDNVEYKMLGSGCPVVIQNTLCFLGAKVVNIMDAGSYSVFLGEVTETGIIKPGEVMTYDYYHCEKNGMTPETAPTYIKKEENGGGCVSVKTADDLGPRYRCTVCNYIYNPVKGDPDGGIAPGTPFKDIPDGWVCPICGVSKDKFVEA